LSKWIFIETNNKKDIKYLYISTIELKKIYIGEIINILLWFVNSKDTLEAW